jgi:SAM-dependent methyltransferase
MCSMSSDRFGLVSDTADMMKPTCVFCLGSVFQDDIFHRPVIFQGLVRRYSRCRGCGSRSLSPMPESEELRKLYTKEYFSDTGPDQQGGHPRNHKWVLDNLPEAGEGLFVDLGCGDGELLRLAAERGYDVLGVEVDQKSADAAELECGCPIRTFDDLPNYSEQASAVHLGDVLEHVADPESLIREAMVLLRPGGLLLVQGPLEANRSLFNMVLAAVAVFRRSVPVTNPPYHVHLVTSRGQEGFFQRLGFRTLTYQLSDISWPAPSRFELALTGNPRRLALYLCRRLSTAARPLAPRVLSNRFEYIGRYTIQE